MEKLIIEEEYIDDVIVLILDGVIDSGTSQFLEDKFAEMVNAERVKIIVDLKNVKYISSAGWGIFVGEIKGIRKRGGDIKLACMQPGVREVFELLEFNSLLEPFNSREEALAGFGAGKNEKLL
ncbi:MAG: hypothetical protein B6D63_06630 [Candidatus Latescibacteria bacterium 4484_7]|nr:MAG: hypothetical protein B6D63_06630 [Candidatus Latescibacteria bacterium 4484_7]RKZ07229.1 MAG: anti-sigma factor antagonist [bacterium]